MSLKRAAFWTSFWIAVSLIFNGFIYFDWVNPFLAPLGFHSVHFAGPKSATEFFAGYVLEKSLSMDNLFVFLLIFNYFKIEPKYQRKALNYGIFGAMILRLIMIVIGVELVNRFEWILWIFGAMLIWSSYKIIFGKEEEYHIENSWTMRIAGKLMPLVSQYPKGRFFIRYKGIWHATPLFIVVLLIESSDVMFAIDSIPAIFSVTRDPYIIYSSNILAILGLRSLYFFLERIQHKFIYVKQGVGLILFVAGTKMLLLIFQIKVPLGYALSIILGILLISIVASIASNKNNNKQIEKKI